MKILVDYDSLLFAALYKVVSISQMKDLILKYPKDKVREMIVLEANERLHNMCISFLTEIYESGFEYQNEDVEYFLTSNIFSMRKRISPTYKANRKRNKWVIMLKKYIIDNEACRYSLELESDDLIADRAKELDYDCLVATVDKDLNQIPGWKFDLFKTHQGKETEYGQPIKSYRGLKYISPKEAKHFIWLQMLTGDVSDNIKGIKGIGEKKAAKLLSEGNVFIRVAREYAKEYGNEWKKAFKTNYRLLKIGY